jgi:hypothetical protein
MRTEDRSLYELPVLPEVSKNEISKIEISKDDTRIVLNKKDETWYMAPRDFPADNELVEAMLAEIETLTLTTLVSESRNPGIISAMIWGMTKRSLSKSGAVKNYCGILRSVKPPHPFGIRS